METFWIKAFQLIVALVILVTVHEFGHYLFARIFGIRVNRFYLFFNPWFSLLKYYPSEGKLQLIAWTTKREGAPEGAPDAQEQHALATIKVGKHNPVNKKGNPSWAATMYGIGWLPLGGYCDIAGMVDETKGADQLASEPQPWEFRSKGVMKRFMVMVAGVLFNFILAIAIYAGIAFHWGEKAIPYQQMHEGMDFSQPMHEAGFQDGDMLLGLNGEPIKVNEPSVALDMMKTGTVVQVLRNHADTVAITIPSTLLEDIAAMGADGWVMQMRVPVYVEQLQGGMAAKKAGIQPGDRIVKVGNDTTPSRSEFYAALDKYPDTEVTMGVLRDGNYVEMPITPNSDAKIGIMMRNPIDIYPIETIEYTFLGSIPRGVTLGVEQLTNYVSSMRVLFTKSGAQQVGGFGTLGSLFPEKWNWYAFWQITAFLSVILAFMNIIPIPGLDGGHVLFLLVELVTRRKPSDKFLEVANTIGFAFLLLLLIYANGNDLIRSLL